MSFNESQENLSTLYESETNDFISSLFDKDDKSEDDFYFETDFLALKGNPDYLKLIRTLAILVNQRIRICKDIEKLEDLRIKSLEDPEKVKSDILTGECGFINNFDVEKLPDIDWSKYKNIDFEKMKTLTTRRMAKSIPLRSSETKSNNNSAKDGKGSIRIRGKVFTESKPETYNQLWTVEEQLRLEQLLVEFPPEAIEAKRWKKIADALGNRTTKQVTSRVQKYFKKLQKAGIAVPGRPRRITKSTKPALVHRRHKHYLYRPTTFFPGVAMAQLGDSDSEGGEGSGESVGMMPDWVDILSQIKEEKENGELTVQHFGYKCCSCGEEPILGTRWSCMSCPQINLCNDCLAYLPDSSSPAHPLSHLYQPNRVFINPQYDAASLGCSSYLDPNFSPG